MLNEYVNHIFCEDCMITMKNMVKDDFKVDCVLTSPPYNTVRNGAIYNSQKARDEGYGRYDIYVEDKTDEEYIDWTINLFNYFDKILSKNGVVIYNLSYSNENTELMWRVVYNILEHTNFTIADNIIWKKKNALTNGASNNKLIRLCEYIYIYIYSVEKMNSRHLKQTKKLVRLELMGKHIIIVFLILLKHLIMMGNVKLIRQHSVQS